jgi:hypothetical protein
MELAVTLCMQDKSSKVGRGGSVCWQLKGAGLGRRRWRERAAVWSRMGEGQMGDSVQAGRSLSRGPNTGCEARKGCWR